jgi:hypothetical protein
MLMAGCGKKEEAVPAVPSAPAKPAVSTPTVSTPAAVAPKANVDVQAEVDKALALAKAGKYTEALAALQGLLSQDITDAQKARVNDAIAQIQKWAAEAATKKAGENMTKSLPKSLPLK